ncbi:hypothetical protein GUJ93_ZPchr0458g22685 [Zizania palustris]|uniref:Uncharacterized protein n=1 Tax=Zizania palustris TaxID=103762 RepID=A0A8J5RDJ6_ZIZPA|nr:hypothetical protein GUJ93_ZPchr0458g22685 [Zizania palustris]
MEKLPCVVFFVSGLLLASVAEASSASLPLSMSSRRQARVLGHKGRGLLGEDDLLGHRHHHQGKHKEQPQVVAMEVVTTKKKAAAAGWTNKDDGARVPGLIDGEDYSVVAMHSPSAPKHKHPNKP